MLLIKLHLFKYNLREDFAINKNLTNITYWQVIIMDQVFQ